jgi:hypothetical protein
MTDTTTRVERLNAASLKRVIEPDLEIPGGVGPGQILGDQLLSVRGLDIELTPEQRVKLSREEIASYYELGLRIEAVLIAAFAMTVATSDVTDPRTVYRLHEMGEETRHSRAFSRLITSIEPTVHHPMPKWLVGPVTSIAAAVGLQFPAMLNLMVLAGEEIPDLMQRRMIDDAGSDPFVREVARYHRQEEARHISFARLSIAELDAQTHALDRWAVRRVAPLAIQGLFDMFVHPLVYRAVGLPALRTWRRVRNNPWRVEFRYEATRAVLGALVEAGVLTRGTIPRGWCRLCGVDKNALPV